MNKILPKNDIEKVRKLAETIKEVQPVLLHADLSIENALFLLTNKEIKLVAIIDPNTMGGDSRWDISLCLRDENNFD